MEMHVIRDELPYYVVLVTTSSVYLDKGKSKRMFVNVGFLVRDGEAHNVVDVPGFIETGKADWHGDKPCWNVKIDGELYKYPPDVYHKTVGVCAGGKGPEPTDFLYVRYNQGSIAHMPPTTFVANDHIGEWMPCFISHYGNNIMMSYGNWVRIDSIDTINHLVYFTWGPIQTGKPGEIPEPPKKGFSQKCRDYKKAKVILKSCQEEEYLPWQHRLEKYDAERIEYSLSSMYHHADKGTLCKEAVQGSKVVDINTCMYIKELAETGKQIRSTIDTLRNLKHKPIQALSSMYLSVHYGYRLSYNDTKTLFAKAYHEFNQITRTWAATRSRHTETYETDLGLSRGTTVRFDQACKVWYRQFDEFLAQALNSLFRWDLFPELENVWDLVPYSFVLDWFLPLGDVFSSIDYHTYASTLRVGGVWYSERYEASLDSSDPLIRTIVRGYESVSPLKVTSFRRWRENELSYPRLEINFQAGPGNWLPAGALILQRIK